MTDVPHTARAEVTGEQGWSVPSAIIVAGLTLTSFFNYVDRNAVSVLIEPIKRSLLLSDTQAGLITGFAFALFYAIMGVPIARLADRRNKATILVLCFLLWSITTAFSGLATSFLGLFLLRLLVGVGEAGCLPTSFAIISERFTPQQRPFAISLFQAGGRVGVALGLAGAGLAGELLGWRWAMAILGGLGVPMALVVALALRGVRSPPPPQGNHVPPANLGAILRFRGFVPLIAAISLASFATYSMTQWIPAFFVRSYGATLASAGVWIGTASGVGGFAGAIGGGLLAGRLLRRHRSWDLWLPAIAYALAMPLFLAAVLSPTQFGAACFYLAATFVATSGSGVALAAVQRFTEPVHRTTANALMLMISALTGVGLGPVAVGFISDLLHDRFGTESLRWALALSTVAFLGAGLLFVITARTADRPADRNPNA